MKVANPAAAALARAADAGIHCLNADGGVGGPITAYEIAQSLWGNVAVTQTYRTLSEVLGHVDLLVTAGRVVQLRDGGVVRFAAAG